MVEWVAEHRPISTRPFILEVGSGNGTLLLALFEEGYSPTRLCGIDYSPDAVKLSSAIAESRGAATIRFGVCDFLTEEPPVLSGMPQDATWDILLDKGTYDAIALAKKDENGESPAAKYPERVARLLQPGGLFLITCMYWIHERPPQAQNSILCSVQFHRRRIKNQFHVQYQSNISVRSHLCF